MTERKKLSLNRPGKASFEEPLQNTPLYQKKDWVNPALKKQQKKSNSEKATKQQLQKNEVNFKPRLKVKILKPLTPSKNRLPIDEAISQIMTFWPRLFPDGKLRLLKIGIQQDMWQEVKEKSLPISKRYLKACLSSIGHHIDYRSLIQLGSFRFDKDGLKVGEVTQADIDDNLQRLARRNKQH